MILFIDVYMGNLLNLLTYIVIRNGMFFGKIVENMKKMKI